MFGLVLKLLTQLSEIGSKPSLVHSSLQNSSGKFEEGSEESSSVHEINTVQMESNPQALVLSTFETIWNAVNQFRLLQISVVKA